jgi:ankyrin repeat protein
MNEKDAYGNTPATRAACKGHVGVIRELVKHQDVDLNACDGLDSHSGFNSSTIAVVQGQVDMVAELSRQGVDLAARDGWGYTPAAWAATWGDVSTIRELAKQKVDLTSTCNTHFSSDWEVSPAAIAARAGHVPVLDELRQQGIDLQKMEASGATVADIGLAANNRSVVQYMVMPGACQTQSRVRNIVL